MIGRLVGVLVEKQIDALLLDVGGIGYEVSVSAHTFESLPAEGESLILSIHQVIREDHQQLYGFTESLERQLFRLLIKVNGVGPKLALSILSHMQPETLIECIRLGDSHRLVGLPGVGKKTAERLLIDMQDKLKQWDSGIAETSAHTSMASTHQSQLRQEVHQALLSLGYKSTQAQRVLSDEALSPHHTAEAMLKAALQRLAKPGA